ncbi:unnamed protein product [Cylicocyclus nassatus]|uniref:NADAR domain-containing protein n=1 Tax=Cylicocyclus nassatus TaxID=53992 RepID=A0AA36GU11_CYLNA|nr:unnamed protein product [Cylicocyclus nassatus]
MVNRARAKKIRVSVLLSPPQRTLPAMTRHQPVVRSLPLIRTGYEQRCPLFLEDEVVVIDNTFEPSTSGRSVEVKRDEPAYMTLSERNRSFRNRLYDPLTAMSSRLQRTDEVQQLRLTFPKNDLELHSSTIPPVLRQNSKHQSKSKRKDVVVCNNADMSKSTHKAIVYESANNRSYLSPRNMKKKEKKDLGIVVRRDFQKPSAANVSPRKRPEPSEETAEPSAAPHVHKTETLTVIIPKRRVALLKNDAAAQSTTCDAVKEPVICQDNPKIEAPTPSPEEANGQNDAKCEDSREAVLPDLLPSNLPSSEKVDNPALAQQEPIANDDDVTSKEEVQSDSDTDTDDDLKEEVRTIPDPPVFKCKISDKNIIPFSSEKYVFSNHYSCLEFIHEQHFPSIEEFYMSDNLSQKKWRKLPWQVMMEAVMAKFKQNRRMRYQLFRTAGSVLVEACPNDSYWGIGLAADDPSVADPTQWKGHNYMGEVLMQVRDVLLEDPKFSDEVEKAKQNLLTTS